MITALALAALVVGAPDARDPLLGALSPGLAVAELQRVASSAGAREVRVLRASDDRALADGLVASRLLELTNRFELAPRLPAASGGGLDPRAYRTLALFSVGTHRWAFAFGRPRGSSEGGADVVRFALVRLPIIVDGPFDSSRRLHALDDALSELARAGVTLAPKTRDPWGNVVGWAGATARGGAVRALYAPEDDELFVLFVM